MRWQVPFGQWNKTVGPVAHRVEQESKRRHPALYLSVHCSLGNLIGCPQGLVLKTSLPFKKYAYTWHQSSSYTIYILNQLREHRFKHQSAHRAGCWKSKSIFLQGCEMKIRSLLWGGNADRFHSLRAPFKPPVCVLSLMARPHWCVPGHWSGGHAVWWFSWCLAHGWAQWSFADGVGTCCSRYTHRLVCVRQ